MNEQTTNKPSPSVAMIGLVDRLTSEGLITLAEAGTMFGESRGSVVRPPTLTRWILKGVKVGGQTHRLEAIRIGGRRFMTSRFAVLRFLAAQQAPMNDEPQAVMPRTASQRERANARAEAELAAIGI